MEKVATKLGELEGAMCRWAYGNGVPREVKLTAKNRLKTTVGEITPHYCSEREIPYGDSDVLLYSDGAVKYVSLMEAVMLKTPVGVIPCNSLMFYEDSSLKHVFWNDELELEAIHAENFGRGTDEISIHFDTCERFGRIMGSGVNNNDYAGVITGVSFYRSGAVKMITIAAGESIEINTSLRKLHVRNAISFYESGRVKAFEPACPVTVDTLIGTFCAYNPLASPGCALECSLSFSEEGYVRSLVTTRNTVSVTVNHKDFVFEPAEVDNEYFSELTEISPIKVKFYNNSIMIADRDSNYLFDLSWGAFEVF